MRQSRFPARRVIHLPLLILGIVVIASCGTSPTQTSQHTQTEDDEYLAPLETGQPEEGSFRDSPYADLFVDAEAALDDGDWMSAQLALPRPVALADVEFTAYENYLAARIAWQRGQLDAMSGHIDQSLLPLLSDALAVKILQLQQRRAQLENRQLDAFRLSVQALERLPAEHPDSEALARQAWHALRRVPEGQLGAATARAKASEEGWLVALSVLRAASSHSDWVERFPGHPAERFLSVVATDAPAPRRIALLLPLSGRIADAAAAVRDGFIASHFQQRASGTVGWDLIVLDTGDYAGAVEAYNAAIDGGAQLVVGPLTKAAVNDLLSADYLPVPLIALNRLEGDDAPRENTLQFALAPEDEAAQIARLAFADGHRRMLLARPAGDWGEKMTRALMDSWRELGGEIAAIASYSSRESHSASLSGALDLDASEERSRRLRRQLSQPIQTDKRRREDLDGVFLLAPSTADARSLKPLLAYHYAGSLPAYATSSANSDERRDGETDLNGLRLIEMPGLLTGAASTAAGLLRGDEYVRLSALGGDAYRLAALGLQRAAEPGPLIQGATGFLSVNGQRQVERYLEPAIFDRGVLKAR